MSKLLKKKFDSIDQSLLSEQAKDALNKIKEATKDFKSPSGTKALKSKFLELYEKIKSNKPEAIKGLKVKKAGKKSSAASVSKSARGAIGRAKSVIAKAKARRESQGIRTDSESIQRDASRPALKAGKRKSKETGKTYYEYRENRIDRQTKRTPMLAHGGVIKWQDVEVGDSALVEAENKLGLIVHSYGRKFHLKFPDGMEKTYDASELKFIKDEEYAKGGNISDRTNYLSKRDIDHLETKGGAVIKGSQLIDGAYVKSGVNFEDGGMADEYAKGGRPKSALMRDRAYQSNEKWEKEYHRVSNPKHPKYRLEDGGKMLPEVSGFKLVFEEWDSPISGKRGTIRTYPTNYWVASVLTDNSLAFDSWDSMVKIIDKDAVKEMWESNMIPSKDKNSMFSNPLPVSRVMFEEETYEYSEGGGVGDNTEIILKDIFSHKGLRVVVNPSMLKSIEDNQYTGGGNKRYDIEIVGNTNREPSNKEASALNEFFVRVGGRYAKGGSLFGGSHYNTGRSWHLDRARHNQNEEWEKPMNERKSSYAHGGAMETYPELDNLASKIADDTADAINKSVKGVKSPMPYKAQYVLEEVVKDLKSRI